MEPMKVIRASDPRSLEVEELEGLLSDLFNSERALIPIDKEELVSLLDAYPTRHVMKASGSASGHQRGHRASAEAVDQLDDLESSAWLLIDVNIHPDDPQSLAEYDAAISHLLAHLGDDINASAGIRMDCEMQETIRVAIVVGRENQFKVEDEICV